MSFKGIAADQELLTEKKRADIAKRSFPKPFNKPVSMSRVNSGIINRWIEKEIESLVPGDDILVDYVKNLLQTEEPDIKDIHFQLTTFLEEKTLEFTTKLWRLLLEAQDKPNGVPDSLSALLEEEMQAKRQQERDAIRNQRAVRSLYDRSDRRSDTSFRNLSRRDRGRSSRSGDNYRVAKHEGGNQSRSSYDTRNRYRRDQQRSSDSRNSSQTESKDRHRREG